MSYKLRTEQQLQWESYVDLRINICKVLINDHVDGVNTNQAIV